MGAPVYHVLGVTHMANVRELPATGMEQMGMHERFTAKPVCSLRLICGRGQKKRPTCYQDDLGDEGPIPASNVLSPYN